jgi:hypothetical protein
MADKVLFSFIKTKAGKTHAQLKSKIKAHMITKPLLIRGPHKII